MPKAGPGCQGGLCARAGSAQTGREGTPKAGGLRRALAVRRRRHDEAQVLHREREAWLGLWLGLGLGSGLGLGLRLRLGLGLGLGLLFG